MKIKQQVLNFWHILFSFFPVPTYCPLLPLFFILNSYASDYNHFLCMKELENKGNEINKKNLIINTIAQNNVDEIDSILTYLFKMESFAYTLYFDKPMSFAGGFEKSSVEQIDNILLEVYFCLTPFSPSKKNLQKGWDSIQKLQVFFDKNKFFFEMRKFNGFDTIFLINKKKFNEIVEQHIQVFQHILGEETTPESLLAKFEHPDADIKKILLENHALLGILLGFGKHNSQLFELRENLYAKRDALDYVKDYQKRLNTEKKIGDLWQKLQFRNDYFTNSLISRHIVGYTCDRKHPESIALENEYVKQAEIINQLVYERNWIENILLQLL